MSDTPRTNDRVVFIDGNPWVNAPFVRELERELNAANNRIKRLEEAWDDVEDAAQSIQDWSETRMGDALDNWRKAKEYWGGTNIHNQFSLQIKIKIFLDV
jgi:hypothetical protein